MIYQNYAIALRGVDGFNILQLPRRRQGSRFEATLFTYLVSSKHEFDQIEPRIHIS